jgi:DNA-binding beta-propeller fold protein YncE
MRKSLTLVTLMVASCLTFVAARPSGTTRDDKRPGSKHDTIWVTNRDQGTLMVFDAETGEARTPVPVQIGTGLGMGTHDLVVSRRTRKAFLINETVNTVTVLSASTLEELDTIPLGPRPHHTKLSPDGKTVYVGLFNTNRIAAIDARSHEVREFASSEEPGPGEIRPLAHAPRPSPDGRFVFVPHEVGNLVTMLRPRRDRIIRSVAPGDTTGGQPSEVLSTKDGETLYVSMRDEGKIKAIDVDTFVLTGEVFIGAGTQPESLILTPDEDTLIVSLRAGPAQLAIVDTKTLTVKGTVQIPRTGAVGDLAVGSPDGRYVYATFDAGIGGQGGVAKVDLYKGTLETWLYPGTGRPHGIYYSTVKLRLR